MQKFITLSLFAILLGGTLPVSTALASSLTENAALEATPDAPVHSVAEFLTDPDTGKVSIRVNGKTILEIDASGITVTGDIQYTGGITDIGDDVPAIASAGEAN